MEQTVFDKILKRAETAFLIGSSDYHEKMGTMLRITEAVGELAAAVLYEDNSQAADSIGYCIVALTVLAAQLKLDVVKCIPAPYDSYD